MDCRRPQSQQYCRMISISQIRPIQSLQNQKQYYFVKLQKKRLALCSFDKYFDGLFISEEIGANKPSKEFFDAVFKALSFPEKESVILIGDSLSADISGGNAYGIKTVLFENKPAGKNTDTIPTFTVRSLREIEKLLDGLACQLLAARLRRTSRQLLAISCQPLYPLRGSRGNLTRSGGWQIASLREQQENRRERQKALRNRN